MGPEMSDKEIEMRKQSIKQQDKNTSITGWIAFAIFVIVVIAYIANNG